MTAVLPERGAQMPRVWSAPRSWSSAGREAVDLAAQAGLHLDPWEAFVLEHSLGEHPDGTWAATEVGLCVPRQNGKDAILEARELAGLFLVGEELIVHSAQLFKTAQEHFGRLVALIESSALFAGRVKRVSRSHGEEGITLRNGSRIKFLARTKSGGRGFSAPLVIFNEAMFVSEESLGALLPTQAAMPNRQRWYVGSAVDQFIHEDGVVFARVRERGLAGSDRLAYFEWSVDAASPDELDDDQAADPGLWAQANPGYGIRITPEAIEDELAALSPRAFAVERLGVGDWPPTDPETGDVVIPAEAWAALTDPRSRAEDPVCLAFDVTPDRSFAVVAAAGRRPDGLAHVEVVEHRRGTGWVVDRIAQLSGLHEPVGVYCDAVGPAASLVYQLEQADVVVTPVTSGEHAKACGALVDMVDQRRLRHLGDPLLAFALRGATRRPLGDAWAWSRKSSTVDISPLVASTLALWGSETLAWDLDGDPVIY